VDEVKELVFQNRIIIFHEVDNMLGIWFWSVQSSLREKLNMRWIVTQFVPKLLSAEQKNCDSMCQDIQERSERYLEFLSKIITGDETLFYIYGPETK
jgi:hypothetical protein